MANYIAYSIGGALPAALFLWVPILLSISILKRFYILNAPIALWKSFSVTYVFSFIILSFQFVPFNIFIEYTLYFLLLTVVFWSTTLIKVPAINTSNDIKQIIEQQSTPKKINDINKQGIPTSPNSIVTSISKYMKINIALLFLLFATTCFYLKVIDVQERVIITFQLQQQQIKELKYYDRKNPDIDMEMRLMNNGKLKTDISQKKFLDAKQTINSSYRYMFAIDLFWILMLFLNYKTQNN